MAVKKPEFYLKDAPPKTILVCSDEFGGEIMTINAHDFDEKIHTRVNEQGQEINEHGRVIDATPIAGPEAKSTKDHKEKAGK